MPQPPTAAGPTVMMLHRGAAGIRGSEICFIESARALCAAGYRVVVLRNETAMDEMLRPQVAALIDFDFPELMLDGRRSELPLGRYVRGLWRLRRLIREWAPALLYANGGLPCQLAVPGGRLTGVPVLCHFHHPAIRRAYYLWLVKFADHCIFPSDFTRRHSLQKAGVSGDVVYNGVDTALFRALPRAAGGLREQLGIADEAVVVGQVGALVPHKRPHLLLQLFARAAPQLSTLHLCLVGKGPLQAELEAEVARLGLQRRVTVTGFVDSVLPYYQQVIDINVLASVEEGLGISVIEGSACALPALIVDSTGLRETVEEGVTGLRVPPDDEAAMLAALLRLARDGELRQRLGVAGRERVSQYFSQAAYHAGVVAAVAALAKSQHPAISS